MPQARPSIHTRDRHHDASPSPRTYNLRSSRTPESDHADNDSEDDREELDVETEAAGTSYAALRRRVAECRAEYEPESSRDSSYTTRQPQKTLNRGVVSGSASTKQQQWCNPWLMCFFVVILLLAPVVYLNLSKATDNNSTVVDEKWLRDNLLDNMRNIRDKFPSQIKSIWIEFFSGITKVLLEKPTEPTVFLLVHQDAETTSCLAREVARVAHAFLNASTPSPLVVDGAALGRNAAMLEDHGELIRAYRPLVEQHRIMILDNLQAVPAPLARALHIFCDAVTPLVQKAVYIFTLNVGDAEGSPTQVAERELYSLWSQLDADILSPLIVRITGGTVFKITHEEANVC